MEEFKRISNVEVAHIAWNILQTMYEDTKTIKINKLQQLTTRFESIRMSDDESFDKFYAKLNDIVNSAYNLGEIYNQPKIIRKILRSLTEDLIQRRCVEAESVTHNYYNSSTKSKFHKNTRLVGKIIEKTSLTNFY